MDEKAEIYQDEFESGKVDAVAEGVGTWKRKPVAVRARLLKQSVVLHIGVAGALFGEAGWWLVEEGGALTLVTPEAFKAEYEYDGPAD